MINKADYLKCKEIRIGARVFIGDKEYRSAFSVDFKKPLDEELRIKTVMLLRDVERTILQQNGYYEALQKEMEATHD